MQLLLGLVEDAFHDICVMLGCSYSFSISAVGLFVFWRRSASPRPFTHRAWIDAIFCQWPKNFR